MPAHRDVHRLLAALAAESHGLVTRRRLRDVGLTAEQERRLVVGGTLLEVQPGVYAVGHIALSRHGVLLAAALGSGPSAIVTSRAAAELWGGMRRPAREIVIVGSSRRRPLRGARYVESTTLHGEDRAVRHGVPTASVPRLLVDMAGTARVDELCNVLHEIEFHHPEEVDRDAIGRCLVRNANRVGIERARRAARLHLAGSAGTMSSLEALALAALRDAGLPDPEVGVELATPGRPIRVDLLYRAERLCIEIDGSGHGRIRTQADDVRRDVRLRSIGISVLRAGEDELLETPWTFAARAAAAFSDRQLLASTSP